MVWTKLVDQKDNTTLPNYLKDLYKREPQQVDSLLSKLINPKDSENKFDSEKCLWVICGGQKPDDFTKLIKANDRSVICGLVWDANFIAYRCKTCGITPCMSLCAECFENGNHEGHDFNMFKSGAGKYPNILYSSASILAVRKIGHLNIKTKMLDIEALIMIGWYLLASQSERVPTRCFYVKVT